MEAMMRSHEQLYIGGKWVAPSGRGSVDVIDAATEEPVGRIPGGNEEAVDRAAKAAAAPLSAFILAEIVHQAGLPAGVFNLITGNGPPFGEMLVRHPRVDMISLTGSTRAGRRVAELAAPSVKRVALELGGKSATVILE